MIRRLMLVISLFAMGVTAQASGIPPEVADRIDGAAMLIDSESFVGSYTFAFTSMIQKPNGKGRREMEAVVGTTRHENGSVDHRLVRIVEDGKDVTAAADTAKVDELVALFADSEHDTEETDEDLISPFGETADHYLFSPPRQEGDSVIVNFEPTPEHRKDDGITAGTVAWDGETLDPLWMQVEALQPPGPLKEFEMRMEFSRVGETMVVHRLFTKGLAKILFITRQFETDMRTSDVRPGVDQPSGSSMEMTIE